MRERASRWRYRPRDGGPRAGQPAHHSANRYAQRVRGFAIGFSVADHQIKHLSLFVWQARDAILGDTQIFSRLDDLATVHEHVAIGAPFRQMSAPFALPCALLDRQHQAADRILGLSRMILRMDPVKRLLDRRLKQVIGRVAGARQRQRISAEPRQRWREFNPGRGFALVHWSVSLAPCGGGVGTMPYAPTADPWIGGWASDCPPIQV